MWLVTNEPDLNSAYTPQQVTQLIQEVVYCENQASIPDADRLPIGVPVTFGTSWGGYSNPTPGVPRSRRRQCVQHVGGVYGRHQSFGSVSDGDRARTAGRLFHHPVRLDHQPR